VKHYGVYGDPLPFAHGSGGSFSCLAPKPYPLLLDRSASREESQELDRVFRAVHDHRWRQHLGGVVGVVVVGDQAGWER
jgi:hypothetical protein